MAGPQATPASWSDRDVVGGQPRFAIAILTVNRRANYIHETLASLFMSGRDIHGLPPVRLFVGSPDTDHLRNLAHHTRLSIEPMSPEAWSEIRDWSVARRLAYNFWRALSTAYRVTDGVCVCEDDTVFRDGFLSKLGLAVDEVQRCEGSKYVLVAYSAWDGARFSRGRRGKYYCSYDGGLHFGNVCVLVSAAALSEAAEFLRRHAVDNDEAPADDVLGWFGEYLRRKREGGMFQTVVSLAQHIGYVSGGTSEHYFSSPTFERPWPA